MSKLHDLLKDQDWGVDYRMSDYCISREEEDQEQAKHEEMLVGLEEQIKALFLELIGDDPKWDVSKEDYGFRDQGKSELRVELREKINKL